MDNEEEETNGTTQQSDCSDDDDGDDDDDNTKGKMSVGARRVGSNSLSGSLTNQSQFLAAIRRVMPPANR